MADKIVNQVFQVGANVLRKKAFKVPFLGKKEKAIIKKMKVILLKSKGIGLAAPQIGENKQIILVGTEDKKAQKELEISFFVLINPQIISVSFDEEIVEEGCLSFMQPEIRAQVSRPIEVKIRALNEKGEKIKLKINGLLARSVLHEIDHLNGVLFTDKADPATIYENKEKEDEKANIC